MPLVWIPSSRVSISQNSNHPQKALPCFDQNFLSGFFNKNEKYENFMH
jgi:hypothetical protein